MNTMLLTARWFLISVVDIALLMTLPLAAPIIATFTRSMPYGEEPYSWGWIYGTYDNPPQGDEGFVKERAPFPGVTNGYRGYINRVAWMLRNPLYGFSRWAAVEYRSGTLVYFKGNKNISDKYGIAGWYFAKATKSGKTLAFEFYAVLPWSKNRCLRARLGWKIMTDKYQRYGFAQLVNTINPFDGFGNG